MYFPLFVAVRHLLARKSRSAVGTISLIAMIGIAISSMALVVVLSVFNGMESLIGSLYSSLETDLRIVPREGKVFSYDSTVRAYLEELPAGSAWGQLLEENALLGYHDRQHIGILVGVDTAYARITRLDEHCVEGEFMLYRGSQPMVTPAVGTAYYLGAYLAHFDPLTVYVPNRLAANWMNPNTAFKRRVLSFEGILSVNADFDSHSLVLPIAVARELLDYDPTCVSAIVVELPQGVGRGVLKESREQLERSLGEAFQVQLREEQNASLYRTMRSERLIIALILSLILLIATFNVVGSLSMLIIDKQRDSQTLLFLGASRGVVRRIFLAEGCLISLVGGVVGIILGLALCWLQERFGLVGFQGAGHFIAEAYPVQVRGRDVLYVFGLVCALGFSAAWIPILATERKR